MHNNIWALHPELATEILLKIHTSSCYDTNLNPCADMVLPPLSAQGSTLNQIAVIEIAKSLTRSSSYYSLGQNIIKDQIDAAIASPQIKGIMFKINSPGGVVAGTKELADHIYAAKKIKPCMAYADGLCASAAFWLAAATGEIYAPLTAQIGSIGVLAVHTDWSKYNDKLGISYTYVSGGKYKSIGNENQPLNDEAKNQMQKTVTALHDIFVSDVSNFLKISAPRSAWAEGQVFMATEAKHLGLIKGIVTNFDEALHKLQKKAVNMDKTELFAQYPDLCQQIQKEAAELAQTSALQTQTENLKTEQANLMALAESVLGKDCAQKLQLVLAAGITPQQYQAIASITAPQTSSTTETMADKILSSLTHAHGQPVASQIPKTQNSSLIADAEKRSNIHV